MFGPQKTWGGVSALFMLIFACFEFESCLLRVLFMY